MATANCDDGIPRHLACTIGPDNPHHSEAKLAVSRAMSAAGVAADDIDLIELQDNTVYYELAFPEEWGFIEPGTAEQWVAKGDTMPTGKLPINPSGGFQSFGEATTAQALWQIVEVASQLRGDAGARQVPNAKIGLAQSLGLGGNATATVLRV